MQHMLRASDKDIYKRNRLIVFGDSCILNINLKCTDFVFPLELNCDVIVTINVKNNIKDKSIEKRVSKQGDIAIDIGDMLSKGENDITVTVAECDSLIYKIYAIDLNEENAFKMLIGYDLILAYVEQSNSEQLKDYQRLANQVSIYWKNWDDNENNSILRANLKKNIVEYKEKWGVLPEDIRHFTDNLDVKYEKHNKLPERLCYKIKNHEDVINNFKKHLSLQHDSKETISKISMDTLPYMAVSLLTKISTQTSTVKLINFAKKSIFVDFSTIIPLVKHSKNFPLISKRQRNDLVDDVPPQGVPLISFKCGDDECKDFCYQDSFKRLINKLFEQKPLRKEFAYLLIYLSVAIDRNLSILTYMNLPNLSNYIYEFNDFKVEQRIQELATTILDQLTAISGFWIDPKKSISDLREDGWHFKFIDSQEQLRCEEVYDKERAEKYASKLERAILDAKKPDEYAFFFRGEYGIKNQASKDILMAISTIEITYTPNLDNALSFSVTFCPLFDACSKHIQKCLDGIVYNTKKNYKEYSSLDLRLWLGKQAQRGRDGKHIFSVAFSDDNEEKLLEEKMLGDVINAGLIEDRHNNNYCFSQKYIRIYLDGFFTAYFLEKQCIIDKETDAIRDAINQIFQFSKPEDSLDHLNFSLAEPSLFSLSLLTQASMPFREKIIIELIHRANNYKVKNGGRFEQELSAHILCYLMAINPDLFKYRNMKDAFQAACSRQLYPAQTHLLREVMKKNAFFKEYPKKIFREALEFEVDEKGNYVFKGQPEFYFYQTFCQDKISPINQLDFLGLTSLAQYESWIKKDFEKAKSYLKKAYDTEIRDFNETTFSIQSSGEAAIKNLYGMQMWLYALSNIYRPTSEYNADTFVVEKVLEKKGKETKCILKHLLEVVFYAEYFQKLQNPYYPSRTKEMTMVCGSYRFINSFNITVSIANERESRISDELIKEYKKLVKNECKTSRYFYFQQRFLSYYTNEWLLGGTIEDYNSTSFLQYDHFPNTYNEFLSNPKALGNLTD